LETAKETTLPEERVPEELRPLDYHKDQQKTTSGDLLKVTRPAYGLLSESLLSTVLRFSIYSLCIFLATRSLPYVIERAGIIAFKENKGVEWCQFTTLVATSVVFFAGSFLTSNPHRLFLFFGSLSLFASARELDSFLDDLIPMLGWQAAGLPLLYAIWCVYKNRQVLKEEFRQFLPTRAFAILWAGFIVVVLIAQLVGHGAFLKAVMGENYTRDYKRVIEEIMESVGYLLLMIGSIEAVVQLKMPRRSRNSLAE